MKIRRVSKILLWATPLMLLFAACIAPAAGQTPLVGNLLFEDNFTVTTGSTFDINGNVTDPARQSGPLAGLTYADLIYTGRLSDGNPGSGYNLLGEPSLPDGVLATTGNYGGAPYPTNRLNKDFSGILSKGGLTISFDTQVVGPYWSGLIIGGTSSSNWPAPGSNFVGIQVGWNLGTAVSNFAAYDGVNPGTGLVPFGADISGSLHHFDYVCTDPGDGNPFDGVGTTHIDCYLDNSATPFYSWVSPYAMSSNYIVLATLTDDPGTTGYNSGNYTFWDNLTIRGNIVNQWSGDATGDWTTGAKWSLGTAPNAAGATACFWNLNTAPTIVDVGLQDVTVGTMDFDSANSYTISSSNGHKIILDNLTANASIKVKGDHKIELTMQQTGSIDFTFGSASDRLVLSGQVTVPGSGQKDWNVNSGVLVINGNSSPNGTVNVNGGIFALIPGGTLTASQVNGSGQLWVEGGSLAHPSGGHPAINIDVLGLGMDAGSTGDYSVDAGETLTVRLVTGGGPSGGTSNFHLNGGTVAGRSADTYIADLTATFLDDDTTINGGTGYIVFARSHVQDGAAKAGHLNLNGNVSLQTANTYTGGTTVSNGGVVLYDAQAFGTGPVVFASEQGFLEIIGPTAGEITNDLTFHGTGPAGVPALYMDWGPNVNLSGKITVNNDAAGGFTNVGGIYYTGPGSYWYDISGGVPGEHPSYLTISGQITGPGGLQFGFPTSTFPSGQWTGFKAVLSGDVANNYAGDTTIMDCVVVLQKNGVVAIPSANVTIGAATPYANPQLRLGADNQINPAAVIHMYADAAGAYWNSFEMMSHSQTIGGLRSNNGVNVISNSFCEAAPDGTVGTLTVNSAAPDNYYYGIIRDISGLAPNTSKFALVKDGAGTLLLEAGGNGWFTYTGTTTINNGALIVTSADATGGVSTTNTLTGDFSGAGTLIVGDGVNHPALNLTNVDMTGTVQVAELATLNAASIKADTLIIGGAPIVTVPHAAAAVPEPSALLLLAIACASIAWFRLKK